MEKARHTSRYAVRDEFLNLDFPNAALLYDFTLHPFMRRLVNEHLEPMVQIFLYIREAFSWEPGKKTETECHTLCQHIRSYLHHTEHVADIVVRYKDLAQARRVPTPSVLVLNVVMKAERVYGFEGDEEPLLQAILRGKIAALFRYSADLRQNAVDRHFIGDGPTKIAEPSFRMEKPKLEEGEVEQFPSVTEAAFPLSPAPYKLQTMDEYMRIPDIVMVQVELCMAIRHDIQQCIHSDEGLMEYVSTIVRPFAHCVSLCIPAGAVESLIYDIAMGRASLTKKEPVIDPRALYSLSLALSLEHHCGSPTAGYAPSWEHFVSRVRAARNLAGLRAGMNTDMDVILPLHIVGLPSVLHWTYTQIEAFKEEKDNSMIFEKMTLEAEYDAAMRLGDNLVRAQDYTETGYGAGPSGRGSPCIFYRSSSIQPALLSCIQTTSPPVFKLDIPTLCVLWVDRARRLAEAILQVFLARRHAEIPSDLLFLVELGKASVCYGPFKLRGPGQSFVPYEATVLFGLAEGFTDAFGFKWDDVPEERAALFHHLDQLFQNMVLRPKYSSNNVDFPNFHLDVRTMYLFGVMPWIKSSQVAKVVSAAVGDRHRFGDNLLRYNPSLGEEGRFVIAIPDDLLVPTRPCTPDVGDLSTISERDETAEGESLEEMVFGRLSQAVFDEVAEEG
ncbi:hypothetical protein FB451DRAFT_1164608 [Mycena latifolia]|nr:hypothetical protein FB451DRAFT_1164608 [Mycena latifolia]